MAFRICLVVALFSFLLPVSLAAQVGPGLTAEGQGGQNIFSQTSEAVKLMQQKKYAEAEAAWQQMLVNEPGYSIGYNNLGLCQLYLQKYEQALRSYEKAEAISPNIDARAGIQWVLFLQKKYEGSITAGDTALQLDPENYWVHVRKAAAYNALGLYNDADRTYEKILTVHGSDVNELYNIGLANYSAGNRKSALAFWQKAYGKDDSHGPTRQALGLYPSVPNFSFLPYYSFYRYSDTQYLGRGQKLGGAVTVAFNDYWFIGGGYYRDEAENPQGSGDYKVNHFNLHMTHYFDSQNSLSGHVHFIKSNDSFTDNGTVFVAAYNHGSHNRFSVAAGGLFYPRHNGAQLSPSVLYNFWGPFFVETTAMGQLVVINTREQRAVMVFPPPPPGTPPPTETIEGRETRFYGAVDASLSAAFSLFTLGAGGRLGTLYTPFILQGSGIVYDPEELKNGLYAFVRVHPLRWLMVNLVYSYDQFSNSSENPVANTVSATVTVRLP